MTTLGAVHPPSLALLTDLYQLTMACGYWRRGLADREAVFHLTFRANPFRGGFTVAAGLATAIGYLENQRFTQSDTDYLATLHGNDGRPLFDAEFLATLRELRPACDVDAVPEGTAVFPHEPLVRVRGPLIEAQLLETPLLNLINFQTLIATKAARIVAAAGDEPVFEFGLRRAQGIDGSLSASRAAYLGGCAGTSNVLAGCLYGIPVKGTHAHSWVMCFDDEVQAFREYARAMPNNCLFLVDTYDTLEGVRHAVEVGRELRARGGTLVGVRLDSGDLAALSVAARRILDEGGFPDAAIFASNELDEHAIADLKARGAAVNIWGVGTRLVTGFDDPALGGVYKLAAIRSRGEDWQYKLKLSEEPAKGSTPGVLQVRRFRSAAGEAVGDAIYDELQPLVPRPTLVDPLAADRRMFVPADARGEDLLVPIFRGGRCVYELPTLEQTRGRLRGQLAMFPAGVRSLAKPQAYFAGLEEGLYDRKTRLIARQGGGEGGNGGEDARG
jgi:nicotinate phosphoribosyltransferase